MIKENIQININDKSFDAEIIVPSQIMTSTPQEESGDLTKSPNFILKVNDSNKTIKVTDIVEVSFSLGDYNYTANMKAYNRGGGTIALQYDSNLTSEEVTHTFECDMPQIETHYDLTSGDVEGMDTYFMYDGTPVNAADISFSTLNYHTITIGELTPVDITLTPKTAFPEITTGEFVDTLTATYKGMTATVTVTLTITEAQELILNAEKYYTAYDISENEAPHNSEWVTATLGGETIDPRTIEFQGLSYNDIQIRSSGKIRFIPNTDNIDAPGVYTDDVTAIHTETGSETSIQVIVVVVDTAAQTGLTMDKPYYACSINQNTSEYNEPPARVFYNGADLDPVEVVDNISGTYKDQYWYWQAGTGAFMAQGMETFSGYDVVTITYNNESISCLLKIDVIGLETPDDPE